MATLMFMNWSGVTRDQYEAVRQIVQWDTNHPDGGKLHVAGFDADGMHITDIWESEDHFNGFMNSRLAAGIQQVGLEGEPEVRFVPLSGVFAPALGHPDQTETI